MNLILDNIIFSLQESGGISVYWYHLVKRFIPDEEFRILYLESKNGEKNIFNRKLSFSNCSLIKKKEVPIFDRYLNVNLSKYNELSIFHSSYYRISKNSNHINITTIHDFTYEHFHTGLKLIVHRNQKKTAVLRSKGIICISENTKKDLLKFIPEVANKLITVIPNGVDTIFKKVPIESYHQLKTPFEASTYILYVGDRSASYKNFKMAVATAVETHKPLAFVGGGLPTEKEIALLNTELKELGYHHFNNIETEELNILYNFAFCLLYPSIYEGFGIPPIEAQKAGCPVVAFNASSIPEVVGDSAILVKKNTVKAFTDAVISLEDEEFKGNLIKRGFENAEKYSWKSTYEQTKAFYARVLEGNTRLQQIKAN